MKESAKILILGKTHVGKSTFINYFLGEDVAEAGVGKPITQELTAYVCENGLYPVEIFDSKGIEAETANEQKTDIISEVKRRNNSNDVFNWFHTIFYCCSAEKRFENFEAQFINELKNEISQHIHIILTKCDVVPSDIVSEMKTTIKNKLNDQNIRIFEVVSVNEELLDGTQEGQRGKEEVSDSVFELLWADIADKISVQYAQELQTAFIDVADITLKNANYAVDKLIKFKNIMKIFKDDTSDLDTKIDSYLEAIADKLTKAQKETDQRFNKILKPLAELYSSYKGIVTNAFADNADLLFTDTLEWVDVDWIYWIDNNAGEFIKRIFPKLSKIGLVDENGYIDDVLADDEVNNLGQLIKAIMSAAIDLFTLRQNLKKLFRYMYDEFVKSVPSEKDIQKKTYDRIIEAMKQ